MIATGWLGFPLGTPSCIWTRKTTRTSTRFEIELRRLLDKTGRSPDEEARVLQLVTLFETFAPPAAKAAVRPGYFPSQRADSLLVLGKPELALLEIEEARRAEPNPDNDHLFLEILRRVDLTRAVREAEALAVTSHIRADVLAECINVLATHADNLPDDQFEPVGRRILDWSEQFERAPGASGSAPPRSRSSYSTRG